MLRMSFRNVSMYWFKNGFSNVFNHMFRKLSETDSGNCSGTFSGGVRENIQEMLLRFFLDVSQIFLKFLSDSSHVISKKYIH